MFCIESSPVGDLPRCTLLLPEDAEIISVYMMGKTPYLNAKVDVDKPRVPRQFTFYASNQHFFPEPDEDLRFVGTVIQSNGLGHWHFFEILKEDN